MPRRWAINYLSGVCWNSIASAKYDGALSPSLFLSRRAVVVDSRKASNILRKWNLVRNNSQSPRWNRERADGWGRKGREVVARVKLEIVARQCLRRLAWLQRIHIALYTTKSEVNYTLIFCQRALFIFYSASFFALFGPSKEIHLSASIDCFVFLLTAYLFPSLRRSTKFARDDRRNLERSLFFWNFNLT